MPRIQTLTIDGISHAMLKHSDGIVVCLYIVRGVVRPDEDPQEVTCLQCTVHMDRVPIHGWELRYR